MANQPVNFQQNSSVLGRLLEELSWVGSSIRDYRNGGRGYENVLTAEALQGLDFLPRTAFLGPVIAGAQGADRVREQLVSEIEEATFTLMPGNRPLIPSGNRHQTQLPVQPDGLIESNSVYAVLEAKRIRRSSFQPEQLAREFVLALRNAEHRAPLLLLILGSAPPIKVAKHGILTIPAALSLYLDSVLKRAENHSITTKQAVAKIPDVVCWITWQQITSIVHSQLNAFCGADSSIDAAITRLANSITRSIDWHT